MIDNFLKEVNGRFLFEESWFDRCIDRYNNETGDYDYIPSYPYWSCTFTPESWVEEGQIEVDKNADILSSDILDLAKQKGIEIQSICFDSNPAFAPKEEAGYDVYNIPDFLKLNHEEMSYEGYVYYGKTIVEFCKYQNKEDIINLAKEIINR